MKMRTVFIAGAWLIAFAGVANADDHLFQALKVGGLTQASQPFQPNGAGKTPGEDAPGQGSPFTGGETHTPATAQQNAIAHANVKQRVP